MGSHRGEPESPQDIGHAGIAFRLIPRIGSEGHLEEGLAVLAEPGQRYTIDDEAEGRCSQDSLWGSALGPFERMTCFSDCQ